MKTFVKIFPLIALIGSTSLYTQELEDKKEEIAEENVVVESRAISPEKKERIQIQRLIEAEQEARANEHSFRYESPRFMGYRLQPVVNSRPMHLHFFALMGEKLDWIGLEDGSRWKIDPSESYKIYNWRLDDALVVTPNTSWFSNVNHNYIISNLSANSQVYANLFIGPKAFGNETHWIVAIDRDHYQVFLENGSSWYVAPSDRDLFNEWEINDTLIVGLYDHWFSSYNRVLINVNMNHYVKAIQF